MARSPGSLKELWVWHRDQMSHALKLLDKEGH